MLDSEPRNLTVWACLAHTNRHSFAPLLSSQMLFPILLLECLHLPLHIEMKTLLIDYRHYLPIQSMYHCNRRGDQHGSSLASHKVQSWKLNIHSVKEVCQAERPFSKGEFGDDYASGESLSNSSRWLASMLIFTEASSTFKKRKEGRG